jgi:multisubunit Na+/H+ antiporter MnhG subunit
MVFFLANILIITGLLIIILCAIAIFKAKDIYQYIHFVSISNIYGLSILLIGLGLDKYSLVSMIKIISLVLFNIIITIIITQSIARRAMINGVVPIGEVQKLD